MNHIVSALLVLTWLALPVANGEAALVHYFDEEGNIHYVNTNISKVPDRYRYQVERQLQAIEGQSDPMADESPDTPKLDNAENAVPEGEASDEGIVVEADTARVELFTEPNCAKCNYMETVLRKWQVKYVRYDASFDAYGFHVRSEYPGEMPILKIGDFVYHGYNTSEVTSILRRLKKGEDLGPAPAPAAMETNESTDASDEDDDLPQNL